MRLFRPPPRGFSLLEVVIAVGIFAFAIAVILAFLAPLSRQAAASADTLAALRLPDGIRTELRRVARVGGFDALAARIPPLAAPLPPTLMLVASRDATRIQSLAYAPPPPADQVAPDDRFFLIETWTFPQAPLAFDPAGAVLALHVRVSWPYLTPGAPAATALAAREQVTYSLSLTR